MTTRATAPLVEAKLAVPAQADRLVDRGRLNEALAGLLAEHRVVGVWATAGAGKTTAVRQAVLALGWPVAWLTLDSTDAAPGRLLVYLEAALRRAFAELPPAAGQALAAGVMHPEAAAALAQVVPGERAVLVLDEIERVAESPLALEVISSFVRYLASAVRVVLIGRRHVELDALSRIGYGAIGSLGEEQLAFDHAEAGRALSARGITQADPRSVVQATGGWVAGVLFEAWRSRDHVGGAGGEADALAGYLAAEILDDLGADEREFLIRTALFTEVTVERAQALGITNPQRLLAALRQRHLPATWHEERRVLRCHPRFREYLRSLLDQRDAATVRELRRRHGLYLAQEGIYEEALEELLSAGFIADALGAARHALPAAIARLDLDVAQAWLDRFDAAGLMHDAALLRAQLTVSVAREEFQRAVDAADGLRALGGLSGTDPVGLEHAVLAAWAYWHVGRLDEIRALVAGAPSGHGGDVMRYLCSLVEDDPPAAVPQLAGGPLDALILRISFARGRLTDVRDAPLSRWTPGATERASALRALGDLQQTAAMLDERPGALANLRFEATVAPELLIDLGDEERAREALLRARTMILLSRSVVLDVVTRLLAAKLELRLRGDATTALEILRGIEAIGPARSYGYLAEQIDMWIGGALLIAGRDEEARTRLEAAVASMTRADRLLELPTAAVYLSEARWRAGDVERADACADAAGEAARRSGSRHLLLQALGDCPAVLARRMDGEEAVDGPWHDLARALATRARLGARPLRPLVHLRDLGVPALVIDGEDRHARISKSYALCAYLIHVGGRATRDELLEALFDGRLDDSSRAYLRQANQVLRGLLPDGIELLREGDMFLLEGASAVETETMLLQARLASATALIGASRLEATHNVVREYGDAVFLEGVECRWVSTRRDEVAAMIADARIDTAILAFELSRFELAGAMLTTVLENDPYREQGWRILMRVAAAQGLEDRVIETFRRCESALEQVGLEPSPSTRLLAERLRR